ncbi:bomanin Short 3-like [Drosophila grimshawi]|uniref:bomanin Short 3-like n=1 Tax=Drosophila grimshawi TaxID=7222 RepID=UPI0013EEF86B|nr:bomanin Short 3-like [Drosophila grimshawi]
MKYLSIAYMLGLLALASASPLPNDVNFNGDCNGCNINNIDVNKLLHELPAIISKFRTLEFRIQS